MLGRSTELIYVRATVAAIGGEGVRRVRERSVGREAMAEAAMGRHVDRLVKTKTTTILTAAAAATTGRRAEVEVTTGYGEQRCK